MENCSALLNNVITVERKSKYSYFAALLCRLCCGNQIEFHYYKPMTSKSTDQKTGTTPGFTLCYKKDNILSISEITQKRYIWVVSALCQFVRLALTQILRFHHQVEESALQRKVSRRLQKGRHRLINMLEVEKGSQEKYSLKY